MRVIMISSDRRIFEKGSAVRARLVEYGALFDELDVIVFSTRRHNLSSAPEKISDNVTARATNSLSRWTYLFDAFRIGGKAVRQARPSLITGSLKAPKIVVTAQDPFEQGLAGWLIASFYNLGLELQVHTDFLAPVFVELSILNRIRFTLAKFLIPRAGALRVVSEMLAQGIEREFGVNRAKITVLPIFVDAKSIETYRPASNLRVRYPRFRFVLLSVARLEPEKNVGLALETLVEVIKKYPLTGLVIIGDGHQDEDLHEKAKSLGVDNNVVFEGWQNNRLQFLKMANALLVTSIYEGYGLSIVEAALSGCPIVTVPVGVAKELTDNDNGLICERWDPKCLAEKVVALIENNELREMIRMKAREHFEKRLPSKRKYLTLYKESIEKALP